MWQESWNEFIEDLKGIPSIIDANEIAAPASNQKLVEIEKKLGVNLPPMFRGFLLNLSAGINLSWSFEGGALVKLEGERESISCGDFLISLDAISEMNYTLQGSYEPDEYDLEYHPMDLLAFADVPNGDQFSVVISGADIDCIKYLSHDIDDIHLYKVGEDIESFLSNYSRIGFVGPEYWIWEQFTNKRTTPIDCGSPNAIEFLDAVRNGRRSLEAETEHQRASEAMRRMQYEKYVLPEAESLIQSKDFDAFVKLLSQYSDLLSGAVKKRYEYYLKKGKG